MKMIVKNIYNMELEVDFVGYWKEAGEYARENGSDYNELKTLFPVEYRGHFAKVQRFISNNKEHILIVKSGSSTDGYPDHLAYIEEVM